MFPHVCGPPEPQNEMCLLHPSAEQVGRTFECKCHTSGGPLQMECFVLPSKSSTAMLFEYTSKPQNHATLFLSNTSTPSSKTTLTSNTESFSFVRHF